MAEVELRNGTNHEFVDISSEEFRDYVFPGNEIIRVSDPQFLHVSRSGHRLVDGEGRSHFVPKGWIHLTWKVKDGQPHFVK